jgi:hypothetical protein
MANPWFAHEHDLQLVDTVDIYIYTPVVPHKAVAEVSKIGNL